MLASSFSTRARLRGGGPACSAQIIELLAPGVEISYFMGEGWSMVSGHDDGRQMSIT
jgi:hypothetical protein